MHYASGLSGKINNKSSNVKSLFKMWFSSVCLSLVLGSLESFNKTQNPESMAKKTN